MNRVDFQADTKLPIGLSDAPYVVEFWVSGACNMRCRYCLHGTPADAPVRKDLVTGTLSRENFLRAADGIKQFPRHVLGASFCGIGEPLTHPLLPEMIAYLKKNHVVSMVQLSTNGLLLDQEMADRLIDAGTDMLSVSIQGVDAGGYEALCGVSAQPEQIARNVAYFYEHKRPQTHLIVRTMDLALPRPGDAERFHEIFDPIADQTLIAHAVRLYQGMDYSELIPVEKDQFRGEQIRYGAACPLLFSTLHIRPNGDIAVCPLPVCPGILGNLREMSLQQAWNSRKRFEILLAHARKNRESLPACAACSQPNMLAPEAHIPDRLTEQIRQLLDP